MKHATIIFVLFWTLVANATAQELNVNIDTIRRQDRTFQSQKADRGTTFFWLAHYPGSSFKLSDETKWQVAGEVGAGWFPVRRLALCLTLGTTYGSYVGHDYWSKYSHNNAMLSARYYLLRHAGFFVEAGAAIGATKRTTNLQNGNYNIRYLRPAAAIGCEYLFSTGSDFVNGHLGMTVKLTRIFINDYQGLNFCLGLSYRL